MRQRGRWAIAMLCLGLSPFAVAASLTVQVTDQTGRPVADAVVTVIGSGATAPTTTPATHTIDQARLTFVPYVEVFRPGDSAVFHNSDGTQHHVYSFSPVKAFQFVVAPGARSTPVVLDRPGVVAVGCNIHDGMINYLYVTDAPVAARTDSRGRVVFEGLGEGRYNVRVWQPRLPAGRPDLREKSIALAAGETKTLAFPLKLRPDPRRQFDREHTHY
jgi:plastocyanin